MDLFIPPAQQASAVARRMPKATSPRIPEGARPSAQDRAALGDTRVDRRPIPDEAYSVQQEAYRDELAYHKRRDRRRKRAAVFRVVLFVVLVPLILAAVFLASYVLTCIFDGASPEEVVELVKALFANIAQFVTEVMQGA